MSTETTATTGKITVVISNNTGIKDKDLYVFIADGNNNFYKVDKANGWSATAQSAACCIALNDLAPSPTAGLYQFYVPASTAMTGGRVWFSTSQTALSVNPSGGITQPTALADYVFDFLEIATNPPASGSVGNANIDTTQVDGLGIPITVFVNPTANGLTFPPTPPTSTPTYGYPDVIGVVPWMALNEIISDFQNNIKGTVYDPFSVCGWSKGDVQRFVAPIHLISDYSSSGTPSALSTFMDQAIYQFFNYYMTHNLTVQDPVSLDTYTGTVTTVTENDINGTSTVYNVFQFTGNSETYNVYYPYFKTNCSAFPGTLNATAVLSNPPSWWAGNIDEKMPATAMALGCTGAFSDSKFQPGVTNSDLLGNLENQLVSLITRGMSPVISNLISFNAQYSAADIVNNQVSITSLPSGAVFAPGMDIVKQVAAQPLTVVAANAVGGSPVQIVITNPVGPVLPVNSCLFLCGEFYPDTTNTAGYSNIYSNYLHNGYGSAPAPLLNNIGYGYAYDDQGGYSNDITANYDSNNNLTLGVFLGPLKVEDL